MISESELKRREKERKQLKKELKQLERRSVSPQLHRKPSLSSLVSFRRREKATSSVKMSSSKKKEREPPIAVKVRRLTKVSERALRKSCITARKGCGVAVVAAGIALMKVFAF